MSEGNPLSLEERLYIDRYADQDQTVSHWLARAKRLQQKNNESSEIDQLLMSLDIGPTDPDRIYNTMDDDLGEWFKGAPSWLSRS